MTALVDFFRAYFSRGAATTMPRLDALPVELLAHVTLYVGEPIYNRDERRRPLLHLRCASKACEAAVRRAVRDHAYTKEFGFGDVSSTRRIAACGRVFGAGCRTLRLGATQSDKVTAIRQFAVDAAQGRILEVTLSSLPISPSALLSICSACPLMTRFYGSNLPHVTSSNADVASFARELGRVCPLLEDVTIANEAAEYADMDGREVLSPAELFQMNFPRIKRLIFQSGNAYPVPGYQPWDHARIEATVTACTRADAVDLSNCTVMPTLVELLLRTPLKGRLRTLWLTGGTDVSLETILQCANGFETLRELALPDDLDAPAEFYASLARARPALIDIDMGARILADDLCVQILVEGLALERIRLDSEEADFVCLSSAIIEIILQSRSAQTLAFLAAIDIPHFTSAAMLRLMRGCPRLSHLEWHGPHGMNCMSPMEDGDNVDEIIALMKARGGGFALYGAEDCLFPHYGPWKQDAVVMREPESELDNSSTSS